MEYRWIITPNERKDIVSAKRKVSSSPIDEYVFNDAFLEFINQAYLARAVSSVPQEKKAELERTYMNLIECLSFAEIKPNLPVELGKVDKNQINALNHDLLLRSRFILPLTYALSDGRSWEMGFSYGSKLLIPIVTPEEYTADKFNTPTMRLPFQIPVVFDNESNLVELLRELKNYDVGFGFADGKKTVLGLKGTEVYDLRKVASDYLRVIDFAQN